MTSLKNNQTGFTLMELTVSISIIALISGLFLANYHRYAVNNKTNSDALYLSSKIREMQNFSLALKEKPGTAGIPEGGWGIYLDKTNNIIKSFADTGNHLYAGGEAYLDIRFMASTSIDSIYFSDTGTSNTASISFQPPDPQVYFCHSGGGACDHKWVIITLKNKENPSITKRIFINKTGLIDIIN